jgi:hypothetical protein
MGTGKWRWYCLPLLITAANAQGQVATSAAADTLWNGNDHRLTIGAEGAYDSNVLYNDLVLGIYRGGYISRDVRQHSMDAMDGKGRAGAELGGRISYAWGSGLFGHADWQPRISASYRLVEGIRFTKDDYQLTFFGNSDLVDQTAHIGPSRHEQLQYSTIGFGIQDRRSGAWLELAVVNGQSLNAVNIRTADLHTAPDGRYLDLRLDGDYWASDTAQQGFGRNNGIGAAVNFQWNTTVCILGAPAVLGIGVRDLGVVAWNSNSVRVSSDTTIHFEGLVVDDVLNMDDLAFDRKTLQDSLGLGFETGTFLRALPARFAASLRSGHALGREDLGQLYTYELTVEQHYLPGYVPYVRLDRNFGLSRALCAGVGMSYGGFGGLRVAAGLDVQAGPLRINLRTTNAVGSVSEQAMGRSVMLGIAAAW